MDMLLQGEEEHDYVAKRANGLLTARSREQHDHVR